MNAFLLKMLAKYWLEPLPKGVFNLVSGINLGDGFGQLDSYDWLQTTPSPVSCQKLTV